MKIISRRFFLIAVGVFINFINSFSRSMKPKHPPLAHHVFFWLKNTGSESDRNLLISGIKTLEAIETVRTIHIGIPASTEKRDVVDNSYSVCELIFFDSVEGQNTYQDHPVHQEFVKKYSHLWSKVVVYDSFES